MIIIFLLIIYIVLLYLNPIRNTIEKFIPFISYIRGYSYPYVMPYAVPYAPRRVLRPSYSYFIPHYGVL